MSKILCLDDLERAAMPMAARQARDYWESGANDMITVQENKTAFDNYRIRARAMRNVAKIDTTPKDKLFGKSFTLPLGIAPSAFHGMACHEGEVATAKAARSRNWPMGLSSYSNKPLTEVKEHGGDNVAMLQLYVFKNRKTSEDLVKRAEKAGYKALALTVDTPFLGQRFSDKRNDFHLPKHLSLGNFPSEGVSSPIDIGVEANSGSRMAFSNNGNGEDNSQANVIDPSIHWSETIPWLRSITNMEIWVKGVATFEDAELAVDAGVDGIWVSNHGGRQLDSTLPALESLPEVVDAVKGRVPVHVDGGVRRGGDIFKALALGADFVWIGRPVLHGLQYDGQAGVELMQDLIYEEFRYVMALAGCTSTDQIDRKCLVRYGAAVQKL